MKNKTILNILLIFCLFALFSAYFIQYVLNHQPCNLCLMQRIPYILAIIVIFINFIFNKYEKNFILILSIVFLSATFLSFYHFGIEQGFIEESLVCNLNSLDNNLTAEEILKQLKEKPISCKEITFKFLGFSLATINTIISLIISVILIKYYFNYEKNK